MVSTTITDVLNSWAEVGVFAYLLPFLMIFAIVFGILSKSRLLGDNKAVHAVLALTVGLLALQFDYVSNFFATIFPYAGIGIAVLLVALILGGLLTESEEASKWIFFGLGGIIFLVILLYTFSDFRWFGGYIGVDYAKWIILILIVVGLVVWMAIESRRSNPASKSKG